MKDYKNIEDLVNAQEAVKPEGEAPKPEAEKVEVEESMLPKTPTGTRINKRGKNMILLAGAGLGLYIVWAIFGLSPKTPTTTASEESINISASSLDNQQDQGQNLVTNLRNQAYGNAGSPPPTSQNANLPIPQGAVSTGGPSQVVMSQGQSNMPGNLAGIAPSGGQSNNGGYNSSNNNAGSSNNGSNGNGQNPYQQALQNGMQSGLTPDGFEGSGQSSSGGYNSYTPGNNNPTNNGDGAALAANAAAIQAVASGSGNQNMQGEKNTFLQGSQTPGNNTLQNSVQNPASPYMIMSGSVIPATLITGINSDLPGQIQAIVSQNIYDSKTGNNILIPQGSKLIGVYDSQVAYGQSRVLIVWSRVIFPNDQYIDLEGMPGADLSGFAGLNDQVNNHYFRIFGSALLMSLFSAGMQLSQPQSSNASGTPNNQQIVAAAMGQELGQVSTQMIQQNLNIQPTLNIRPGDNFNVLVTRDIPFSGPYNDNAQQQVLLPASN